MTKANLKLVSPAKENRTVIPLRRPNAELRPREHLTEREVEKVIEAAKGNRWEQRTCVRAPVHHCCAGTRRSTTVPNP